MCSEPGYDAERTAVGLPASSDTQLNYLKLTAQAKIAVPDVQNLGMMLSGRLLASQHPPIHN
jgi:hypothetical protein